MEQVHLPRKTIRHSPTQKLLDVLRGPLAGCSALYRLNVKVCPDRPLQLSFGREGCADQSTVADTLDAFTEKTVAQLREAVEAVHRQHGRVFTHNYEQELLVLEVDLTGLVASKNAEGSTKGQGLLPRQAEPPGRQLVRVTASQYGEVLFEKLYM